MKLETRNTILKQLSSNYALIRDEDGEILCLLGRDDNGYYALYMEHYCISKEDAEGILDKSAGIAFLPVVDSNVENQYKKDIEVKKEKILEQVEQIEE